MKVPTHLSDTRSVPGTNGLARTRREDDGTHSLFVRFGFYEHQYKWRHVGSYRTRRDATEAVRARTYGF